ncbi:MAG: alcohol dehydrogenase catalytic domain-containing protein, partial [Mycobacterium sp.]
MSERAAVLREIGKPLQLEQIELAPIAPDQVRVRIAASGVCHSDLSQATGALPAGTPCVLGHEGAGVVEDVGAEVHHVKPGDHVVIAWTAACHHCWFCLHGEQHLCQNSVADSYSMPYATDSEGTPLYTSVGVSSFGTATNCLGRAVVPIHGDIPLDIASLIGCGVATGAGAAFNTAPVEHGSAIAVIGLGGVGLASLMA